MRGHLTLQPLLPGKNYYFFLIPRQVNSYLPSHSFLIYKVRLETVSQDCSMNLKRRDQEKNNVCKMPTIMPDKGQHSQLLAIMMVIIINPLGQCFSTFENSRFLCEKPTSLRLLSSTVQDWKCQRNQGCRGRGGVRNLRTYYLLEKTFRL